MRKVLFCNNCWMSYYKGDDDDKPVNGGSYRDDWKHEKYNFLVQNGKCYGYVQPPIKKDVIESINLERIDPTASPDDDYIEDVLVIFTATSKYKDEGRKGSFIVGWYDHATVYRDSYLREGYNHYSYYFEADAENCTLIKENDRFISWRFMRSSDVGEGFMGESNIWYADASLKNYSQDIVKNVADYVESKIIKIENYDKRQKMLGISRLP